MQAFPALSDIPATCLALPIASLDIAAADRFGAGDCIAIDVASTELEDGALYLRRFGPNTSHSSLSVWRAELRYTRGELRWWLFGRGPFASDGPYLVDDAETRSYLSQSIVGRVVGCVSKTVDAASVFPPAFAALAAESQSGHAATRQKVARLVSDAPLVDVVMPL
ncbi:MAG: hypothetical protein C0472_03575 [Erythrobacter sp.]|nr:hypothetical protein [Erythrobacter sp.]MBA4173923.1 hypothetical protein [Hyphomicrobium sp.]